MKSLNIRFTGANGTRLDKFLAEKIPDLSRTQVRKIIDRGGVKINRKTCRIASRPLALGARVEIMVELLEDQALEVRPPWEFSADLIIFEDEDILAVNKPAGLPAQSTMDPNRDNIYTALQVFLAKRAGVERDKIYCAIHHRLDRDTTGVMLFTKTQTLNKDITDAFRDRTAAKEYWAIVHGHAAEDSFSVKRPISLKTVKPGVFACVEKGGNSAFTEFTVVARGEYLGEPITVLKCHPKTGRTHQIRVHISSLGHPILGDKPYGSTAKKIGRSLLHAHTLKIIGREFTAPIPPDMQEILDAAER